MIFLAIALFFSVLTTVDAVSIGEDQPSLPRWVPFVWEYSSGLMIVALLPALRRLALRLRRPATNPAQFALWLGSGFLLFAAVHILGFSVLRALAYEVLGEHYRPGDVLYEVRKDAVTFVAVLAALWLGERPGRALQETDVEAEPGFFTFREGATRYRLPTREIVAIRSARNYVEFYLSNGRTPLVRDTLRNIEQGLVGAGFVRPHRSWLINPVHVRVLTPATGGDFRLDLTGGVTAPLSRRFPDTLSALRKQVRA